MEIFIGSCHHATSIHCPHKFYTFYTFMYLYIFFFLAALQNRIHWDRYKIRKQDAGWLCVCVTGLTIHVMKFERFSFQSIRSFGVRLSENWISHLLYYFFLAFFSPLLWAFIVIQNGERSHSLVQNTIHADDWMMIVWCSNAIYKCPSYIFTWSISADVWRQQKG